MYKERTYRKLIQHNRLTGFRVVVEETDIGVHAETELYSITKELILKSRGYITSYIEKNPEFATSLLPYSVIKPAPSIIIDMADAGKKSGVGPMASVAGAVAEFVGTGLFEYSEEIIVENGGDIFFKLKDEFTAGIYAGESSLSMQIGIRVDTGGKPAAICTSSGTVGHSLSMGNADAVTVMAGSCALADAAATSIGNKVRSHNDIEKAIDYGRQISGLSGIVVIVDDKIGIWGDIVIVPLQGKKG